MILARTLPCFEMVEKNSVGSDDIIYRSVAYMAAHFREDFSLTQMAEDLGYSPYALSRVFSSTFHCNFNTYLNNIRLDYSCNLLQHSDRMNHRFLIRILTDKFKSHDLGSAADVLRRDRNPEQRTDILDKIDTEAVTKRLMDMLEIRNKEEQSIGITNAHIEEIKEYLKALDLIVDVPRETVIPSAEPLENILFTQPGMRYCQAQALVHSLTKDELFSTLSEHEKMLVSERILEEVRGRMMEDIVLLETFKSTKRHQRVFKLQFAVGEYDMVIYDAKLNTCECYEIKHSSKIVPMQARFLVDEEKLNQTSHRFGQITKRCVLYRGEDSVMENGVEYQNVENYLKHL